MPAHVSADLGVAGSGPFRCLVGFAVLASDLAIRCQLLSPAFMSLLTVWSLTPITSAMARFDIPDSESLATTPRAARAGSRHAHRKPLGTNAIEHPGSKREWIEEFSKCVLPQPLPTRGGPASTCWATSSNRSATCATTTPAGGQMRAACGTDRKTKASMAPRSTSETPARNAARPDGWRSRS